MHCRHLTALLAAALLAGTATAQLPAPPGGAAKRTEKSGQPDGKSEARTADKAKTRGKRQVAPMRDAWLRWAKRTKFPLQSDTL